MDIKYGINEALTLDVTLLPDFGQVVFDKQVLNISPLKFNLMRIDSFLQKEQNYLPNQEYSTAEELAFKHLLRYIKIKFKKMKN